MAQTKPEKPPKPPSEFERMSIMLDASGDLAVDRMQEGSIDKLRAALSKHETRARLGLVPPPIDAASPAPPNPAADFSPMLAGLGVNLLAMLDVILIQKITGAPPDVMRLAVWTAEEKASLYPSVSTVMDKYTPEIAGKYAAEIALFGNLTVMTLAKVQAINAAMKRPADVIPFPTPTPPPAPPQPAATPEPPTEEK